MRRALLIAAGAAGTLAAFSSSAGAAAGDLDTTFGTGGRTITPVGSTKLFSNGAINASASDSLVQPDGKLLLVGGASRGTDQNAKTSIALVRLNADGSLDPSFNDDGVVNLPIETDSTASGVTLSGGKIYVAGATVSGSDSDVLVARLTTAGTLDTSFGGGTGFVKTSLSASDPAERAASIDTAPDGSLVVLATVDAKVGVLRLTAEGAPLPGFGDANGAVLVSAGGQSVPAPGATVLSDGRVLFGGRAFVFSSDPGRFFTMRVSAAGLPDTGYGTGGYTLLPATTTNESIEPFGFLVDSQGRALVSGNTFEGGAPANGIVARALPDGGADTTFGTNGALVLPASGLAIGPLAEVADGNLLFTGLGDKDGTRALLAGRMTGAGVLDPSWSGDGLAFYTTPSSAGGFGGVLPQADGTVVGVGQASDDGDRGMLAVRFLGDPVPAAPSGPAGPGPGVALMPPSVAPPAPPTTTPLGGVKLSAAKRSALVAGTFAIDVRCSRACSIKATVRASRADARKLKLDAKAKKAVTVATDSGKRTTAGTLRLKPRALRKFAARLRRLKRVPLTVTLATTDPRTGRTFTTTRKVTLR